MLASIHYEDGWSTAPRRNSRCSDEEVTIKSIARDTAKISDLFTATLFLLPPSPVACRVPLSLPLPLCSFPHVYEETFPGVSSSLRIPLRPVAAGAALVTGVGDDGVREREKRVFGGEERRGDMSEAVINGLAGAGGGIIAQLITYPLQTVNTRQQTDREPDKARARDGTIGQMCQVVRREGWQRLYGGLTPSLAGTAASQGVYYYFYQIFRSRAENAALDRWKRGIGDGSVGMFQSLVAAALSGCMNVLLTNPIWVVVTRMQTHTKTKSRQTSQPLPLGPDAEILAVAIEPSPYRTSHAVQEVYGEAGIWGFWKGVFPTLIMVANPSIQFMLYETLLKKLKERRATNMKGTDGVTALEIFLLGAIAKLGATVVTYPLLVVKSRLQAKQVISSDKRHHYGGTLDAIAKMIRYEGLAGFYRGMSTKIVQSVLAAAVLFMVKEELVKGARLLVTGNISSSISKPRQ